MVVTLWLAGLATPASATNPPPSPTEEQKGWALATSAILFQRNMDSHDLLGGAPRTDRYAKRTRELLSDWWGNQTRADLLSTLRWIQMGGHRAEFARLGATLDRLNPTLVAWVGPWILSSQLGHRVAVVQPVESPPVGPQAPRLT